MIFRKKIQELKTDCETGFEILKNTTLCFTGHRILKFPWKNEYDERYKKMKKILREKW